MNSERITVSIKSYDQTEEVLEVCIIFKKKEAY
jgi:hypothetical protein